MNNDNHISPLRCDEDKAMAESLLLADIERYFNCKLTDAEETDLRHRLAGTAFIHPAINEARAVMGLRRPIRSNTHKTRGFIRAAASVAASVTVLAALSVFVVRQPTAAAPDYCLAYVNGVAITAEEDVLRLTLGNLDGIYAPDEMEADAIEDLDALSGAVEIYENDDPFIY